MNEVFVPDEIERQLDQIIQAIAEQCGCSYSDAANAVAECAETYALAASENGD